MARAPRTIENEVETEHDETEATGGEITTLSQRAVTTIRGPANIKIKRQITRPLLKHADLESVAVRFVSEPYVGKEIKSQNKMGVALMINVNDLKSGATGEFQYILNSVLFRYVDKDDKPLELKAGEDIAALVKAGKAFPKGELHDAFPEGLMGHLVAITKFPKEGNKRYNTFEVVEVELAE